MVAAGLDGRLGANREVEERPSIEAGYPKAKVTSPCSGRPFHSMQTALNRRRKLLGTGSAMLICCPGC